MATDGPPLRDLAKSRGLAIGAAAGKWLWEDPGCQTLLGREFSLLTPENALKMGPLRPAPDQYDFAAADALVGFARQHGMETRGHALVWHVMLPDWLPHAAIDGLPDILRSHIGAVMRRYRGAIRTWDVVNEAFESDGGWRDSCFLRAMGPNYLPTAFHWAHSSDPDARLFYNDYEIETVNPKSDAVYALAADMVRRNLPIHGIGMQAHLTLRPAPDFRSIAENIRRFNRLGLDVQITEMDVRIKEPATPDNFEEQARIYGEMTRVCLQAERCSALVVWGVSDKHSWIPAWFPGEGQPLLFDAQNQPKPAYHAVSDALAGKFKTPARAVQTARRLLARLRRFHA